MAAHFQLGIMYFEGLGTTVDYEVVLKWFNLAKNKIHTQQYINKIERIKKLKAAHSPDPIISKKESPEKIDDGKNAGGGSIVNEEEKQKTHTHQYKKSKNKLLHWHQWHYKTLKLKDNKDTETSSSVQKELKEVKEQMTALKAQVALQNTTIENLAKDNKDKDTETLSSPMQKELREAKEHITALIAQVLLQNSQIENLAKTILEKKLTSLNNLTFHF